jgi:two-component system sensor histidine kinase/response regulator
MKKTKILYIDDEVENLNSFRATFRREYDILTAQSASEARALLQNLENEVPIIISDQRMPDETGIAFFESIKSIYPNSYRILLTGYTDIEDLMQAVNIGNVFRYIQKPWQVNIIQDAISSAMDLYNTRLLLLEKNIQLEKAYNELDKFVYSASHDMRAPLMSILGIIRLAKLENNPNPAQYCNLIEQSVLKLDDFIRKIIDYYKNNRFQDTIEDIKWETLIHYCIEANRYLHSSQRLKFQTDINQNGPYRSDKMKWMIILNNLISNAIKYQRPNADPAIVSITVHSTPSEVTIRVEDNGEGIKQSDLDNIFKMFYRSSHVSSGSGIGLYIVKEAVNKLNGSISVMSELGTGTIFQITVPNRYEP